MNTHGIAKTTYKTLDGQAYFAIAHANKIRTVCFENSISYRNGVFPPHTNHM